MKKLLFTLFALTVLLLSACKSDIEPQVSFIINKQAGEGTISIINTTNMYESATINWDDGKPEESISGKEIFHTYSQNGSYDISIKAKNGSKTGRRIEVVNITDVSGSVAIYTQLPIGQNTEIGYAGLFCQITGNGILKYFYIKNGIGAELTSCSQVTDENIWKVPAGDYLVYCENMGKKLQWNFNVRVESGKCQVRQLTK